MSIFLLVVVFLEHWWATQEQEQMEDKIIWYFDVNILIYCFYWVVILIIFIVLQL